MSFQRYFNILFGEAVEFPSVVVNLFVFGFEKKQNELQSWKFKLRIKIVK